VTKIKKNTLESLNKNVDAYVHTIVSCSVILTVIKNKWSEMFVDNACCQLPQNKHR